MKFNKVQYLILRLLLRYPTGGYSDVRRLTVTPDAIRSLFGERCPLGKARGG